MLTSYLQQFTASYPFLMTPLFNNPLVDWAVAVAVFFAAYAVLKLFKLYLLHRLRRWAEHTENEFDDVFVGGLEAIHWPFNLFIAMYIAQRSLALNDTFQRAMYYVLIVVVTYYVMRMVQAAVDVFLAKVMKTKKDDSKGKEGMRLFSTLIKLGLWAIALLLVLSNLGYDVTSLVAGLGVGGIIVAFAIQNIVADLFSSLSIYFDKPFAPGDFVIVGDKMGTVKHVGLRTTRIQALAGEELVVPNSEITSTTIQNYGRMNRRRVEFSLGVTYGTDRKKLEKIPGIVQTAIESVQETEFDRAHFKSYGDFSLNYEVVYYVQSADYNQYMDIQQDINMAVYEAFGKEKIEFAFPTQTIHIEK